MDGEEGVPRRRRRAALCAILAACGIGFPPALSSARTTAAASRTAAPPTEAAPVRATASVDRTAVWVGDTVTYAVEIVCAPGVGVLPDDVAKEKLRLNGLEVLSTDATSSTGTDGRTVYRLRYVLTTYRVDLPTLSIEPFAVRYYQLRPGQRPQDVPPAGDLTLSGAALAFRSTLPDAQATYPLRAGRPPLPRSVGFARAQPVGAALIVVSLVPVAAMLLAAVRRRRPSSRRARRPPRFDQRAALGRLQALDVSTEADRRRAYDEIGAAIREYLAAHHHVPAHALTAQEIGETRPSAGRVPLETAAALLATCDRARYAPLHALPSSEACRDALSSAAKLLAR